MCWKGCRPAQGTNEELMNMGYSEEQIKSLRAPDFCGRIGYPSYMLQNNNANIHRVEGRLNQLRTAKEKGTQETEFDAILFLHTKRYLLCS